MNFVDIYNQISNSASIFGALLLIAVALWFLVFTRMDKQTKK